MKDSQDICQKRPSRINLTTSPFKRGCRYHRCQGQTYCEDNIFPKNFCPHAYVRLYPQALSMLYSPSLVSQKILCPNQKIPIEFLLSSHYSLPLFLRTLKKLSLFLLNRIGLATEFPDKKILIKINHTDNKCPCHFKNGDIFTFNIWRGKELCPASFYSMYPLYRTEALYSFHCPDPDGVSYQTVNGDFNCQKILSDIKIKRGSLCPLLVYSLYPYYLTLKTGGRFEWVKPNENVKVQCPYRMGVATEVSLDTKKIHLRVQINSTKGSCYFNLEKGKIFSLSDKDFNQIHSFI